LTVSASYAIAGAQPLIERIPAAATTSAAPEAVELLDLVHMPMLPWQTRFLTQMLAETHAGRWAAPEVALIVPRQNGKSYVIAARVLVGLFLVGERLITYTAHRVDTALEVFNLVDQIILDCPETAALHKRTTRTGGKETIELKSGARFKVIARARATGRGFTGDCLILDEALELRDFAPINALLPTLATKENAQLIWARSAGDAGSIVLAKVRERGQRGDEPGLLYVEYAAERTADPDDRTVWLGANPGAPSLIGLDAIQRERERMSLDGFRQERLGIWAHELSRTVIPGSTWIATTKPITDTPELGRLGLAFDVSTDRAWASVVAAWRTPAGVHVRVSRHDAGDAWLVPALLDLQKAWRVPITFDEAGPARDVGEALKLAGVEIDPVNGRDFASSCARLLSGLTAGEISHHRITRLCRLTTRPQTRQAEPLAKAGHLRDVRRRYLFVL
jgi:phage terminase large subunit-like protein